MNMGGHRLRTPLPFRVAPPAVLWCEFRLPFNAARLRTGGNRSWCQGGLNKAAKAFAHGNQWPRQSLRKWSPSLDSEGKGRSSSSTSARPKDCSALSLAGKPRPRVSLTPIEWEPSAPDRRSVSTVPPLLRLAVIAAALTLKLFKGRATLEDAAVAFQRVGRCLRSSIEAGWREVEAVRNEAEPRSGKAAGRCNARERGGPGVRLPSKASSRA